MATTQPVASTNNTLANRPTITSWAPFSGLHDDIDRFFGRYLPQRFVHLWNENGERMPELAPMDISETPDALDICMDVPGMTDKDVEVTLADDVLTIKGERKNEIEEKKADFHRVERSFGSFLRRFELPSEVDEAKVTATVTKGVLKVHLPKSKDAKARETKIAIKSA